jgi:hypothetical protein
LLPSARKIALFLPHPKMRFRVPFGNEMCDKVIEQSQIKKNAPEANAPEANCQCSLSRAKFKASCKSPLKCPIK